LAVFAVFHLANTGASAGNALLESSIMVK